MCELSPSQLRSTSRTRKSRRDGRGNPALVFRKWAQTAMNEIYVWNEFMRKRGWNDEVSEILKRRKREAGMTDRSDIQTAFHFIDADEGRVPKSDVW